METIDLRLSGSIEPSRRSRLLSAVVVAGTVVALLDALDAIVAFRLALGLGPVQIYQFVASGMLGPAAFAGGLATALVGVMVHCSIAYSAAAVFVALGLRVRWLLERATLAGSLFGVGVFAFMNYVVIPLSLIPPSPFSLPLFLNGVIGHILCVGLPIAYAARYYLGRPSSSRQGQMKPAEHFSG